MPFTPSSRSASFTSSSWWGLITAMMSFIARDPPIGNSARGGLLPSCLLLRLLDGGLQRLHQIDHLGGFGLGDHLDLLACHLLLHDLKQSLPVFVVELLGVEFVGQVLDEAGGHLDLLGTDLHV